MADKDDKPKDDKAGDAKAQPKKSKKPLFIAGGAGLAVLLGFVASTMAVPKPPPPKPKLEGPFVSMLSKEPITVNLMGEGSKRFLVMSLQAEYLAYDEQYVAARLGIGGEGKEAKEDPLYTVALKDALLNITTTKTRDQVTDAAQIDAFLEEVRAAVSPILFQVCVGDAHTQEAPDSKSGLRLGESVKLGTLRGLLHEHLIKIDAKHKIAQLDDGPSVEFKGHELDLCLKTKDGKTVYIDVSELKAGFAGEISVGLPGKLRRIYRDQFLVQ